MKKVLLFILTIAMLMTLPLSAFAAESTPVERYAAEIASTDNLAKGAGVYTNWNQHWDEKRITDGDLNGSYGDTGSGTGWHGGDANVSRPGWIAIDFGKEVTINKVVLYPTTSEGYFSTDTNAFSLLVPDSNIDSDGKIWIGEGCEYTTNHITTDPTGTVIYERYAIEDPRATKAEPWVCYLDEPVTTQYLVYYSLSNVPGGDGTHWGTPTLSELAAYYEEDYVAPTAPTNLALTATATSEQSHEDGFWHLANLTDGDRYNMCTNKGNDFKDYGQFCGFHSQASLATGDTVTINLDLGAVKSLDTFTFYPATNKYGTGKNDDVAKTFPANYTIQVSETGEDGTWTTAVTSTTGITEYGPVTHTLENAVNARYVRLEMVKGEDHIKISEFEIYGPESGTTPDTPDDSTLSSGDALFSVFYQTRPSATAGANDLRIVLIADETKLQALATTATVKVTFHLTDGTVKSFSHKLGGSDSYYKNIYRTIKAGDDIYTAAEGYVIFGDLITDIPDGSDETKSTYDYFTVEIIDNADNSVLLPAVSSKS